MADYETQIVVVAGGPSGLSAAVQAAEDGAEVIVLEKAAAIGGAANMGMGPLGIGTKYQKRQMEDITVEKAFNMFMEYTHYNVDARLVKRYFEQSAETIEWLEDMGVEFVYDVDKEAFREATAGMIDEYREEYPGVADLLDRIDGIREEEE